MERGSNYPHALMRKKTPQTCHKATNPPNSGEVFGDANDLQHVPPLFQLMPPKRITSIDPYLYLVIIMENIASILEAIVISKYKVLP